MCARIDVIGVARNFAGSYIQANPQATLDQVQTVTRNHLLGVQAKGEKVPAKKLAQVSSVVSGVYAQRDVPVTVQNTQEALAVRTTSPKVENIAKNFSAKVAVKQYTAADAGKYYDQVNSLQTDKAKKHARLNKVYKALFGKNNDEYTEYLKQHNLYEEPKSESKPISNKQNKKQANAEYSSSKKVKEEKKKAEIRSKKEHECVRKQNTRAQRNAKYCSQNGHMATESGARANYQKVLTEMAESAKRTMPIADWVAPERHFANINPQDLEVAFGAPIEAEIIADEVQDISKSTTMKTVEEVANAAKKATKSHNKVLMAVGGIGFAIAAAFGYKGHLDKAQTSEQNEQISAVA